MVEQSSDIPFAVRVTPSPTLRLGMPMLWKLNRSRQNRISTGPELAVTGLQQKKENYEICLRTGYERRTAHADLPLREGPPDVKIRTGKSGGYPAVHDPAIKTNQNQDSPAGHCRTGLRKNQYLKTYFLKSLHFGYFKIYEPKRVTKIGFRMTGVRTGMHFSES